jgi:hypothetical protein
MRPILHVSAKTVFACNSRFVYWRKWNKPKRENEQLIYGRAFVRKLLEQCHGIFNGFLGFPRIRDNVV